MFDYKSDDTIFDDDYRNFDDGIVNDDKMNGDKIKENNTYKRPTFANVTNEHSMTWGFFCHCCNIPGSNKIQTTLRSNCDSVR